MKSTTIVSVTAFIAGVVMAVAVKILVDMKMFSPDKYKDGVHLVFAIMSAPDHFEERQAIRETWLPQQNTTDKRFRGWFIIGNKSCDVHPDNRVSIYGCERIQFAYQENFENVKFVTGEQIREKEPVSSMPLKHVFKQLNFKVLHPLKVKQLGVLSEALEGQNRTVTVTITCRASQEVSAMASFSFKDQGMSDGIYNFQPVRETTLPKEDGYVSIKNKSRYPVLQRQMLVLPFYELTSRRK